LKYLIFIAADPIQAERKTENSRAARQASTASALICGDN
jgi:hypothetical protein